MLKKITSGPSNSTLVLFNDGTVKSVGYNYYGELGLGFKTTTSPFSVTNFTLSPVITGVKDLITASGNTWFIMNDGSVKGVGNNDCGQLGQNNTLPVTTPTTIPGLTGVRRIAVAYGGSSVIFQMEDGTIKVCGRNHKYQLGIFTSTASVLVPTTVAGIANVKWCAIDGNDTTIFVFQDGTAKGCGGNDNGELGLGHTNAVTSLTTLNVSNIHKVAMSYTTTIFLLNDGTTKGCGANSSGELGQGNKTQQVSPITLTGMNNVSNVIAQTYGFMFKLSTGAYKYTGIGGYGARGDGVLTDATTWIDFPTNISFVVDEEFGSASGDVKVVKFFKGGRAVIPAKGGDAESLYFTEDTGELFKSVGAGEDLIKITDIELVEYLPEPGKNNTLYIVTSEGYTMYSRHGNKWTMYTMNNVDNVTINKLGTLADTVQTSTIDFNTASAYVHENLKNDIEYFFVDTANTKGHFTNHEGVGIGANAINKIVRGSYFKVTTKSDIYVITTINGTGGRNSVEFTLANGQAATLSAGSYKVEWIRSTQTVDGQGQLTGVADSGAKYVNKITWANRDPDSSGGFSGFTLHGSNDGTNWVLLHTYTGVNPLLTGSQTLSNPGTYLYYKFTVTKSGYGGGNSFQTAEITLWNDTTRVSPIWTSNDDAINNYAFTHNMRTTAIAGFYYYLANNDTSEYLYTSSMNGTDNCYFQFKVTANGGGGTAYIANNQYYTIRSIFNIDTKSWEKISNIAPTESLNNGTISYSITFNNSQSFKVFKSNVWKTIASKRYVDHGGPDGKWYYYSSGAWVASNQDTPMDAITRAIAADATNRMSGTELTAITEAQLNGTGGFINKVTSNVEIATTFYTTQTTSPKIDYVTFSYYNRDVNGAIRVKDGGVSTNKLADGAVTIEKFAVGAIDTDVYMANIDDNSFATQRAIKIYTDSRINGISNGIEYKGLFDASIGNFNAIENASQGDLFKISVAGTIGSLNMSVGDVIIVNNDVVGIPTTSDIDLIDNTEAVDIVRLVANQILINKVINADVNIINNLTTSNFAIGAIDDDGTMLADSSNKIPTQRATKYYSDTTIGWSGF